ncbi:Maf family protein [Paracoccaceae bacterium GXU_MW_L88]
MTDLTLASASKARAAMLTEAGLTIDILPARIDETAIKAALLADGTAPRDIADHLAEMKAAKASSKVAGLVLGADQILVCDHKTYNKPETRDQAASQLKELRGKTHELLSAAVIFEDGKPIWRHIGRAKLMMRPIGDAFLDDYLDSEGDQILSSVGAYRLEGRGAQLFTRVEGDYFTVLGLPLLEILNYMRVRGVLLT